MNDSLRQELQGLIIKYNTGHTSDEFFSTAPWLTILEDNLLSEDLLRLLIKNDWLGYAMTIVRTQTLSESFIIEYHNTLSMSDISKYQKLTEDFIRKFSDKLDPYFISEVQVLSEDFIREFKNYVRWKAISSNQKLSENFIREFQNYVCWSGICQYQTLSENFIREFQDRVDWRRISFYQKLSESFVVEFKDCLDFFGTAKHQNFHPDFFTQYCLPNKFFYGQSLFPPKSDEQKLQEIKAYAEKYNLEFDGEFLYAFREHDKWGRGVWNKTIRYDEIGKYYQDWHCDLDPRNIASFGLGIWPKNEDVNTRVKVHYKDWGCEIKNDEGKGRVWAFTLLGPINKGK